MSEHQWPRPPVLVSGIYGIGPYYTKKEPDIGTIRIGPTRHAKRAIYKLVKQIEEKMYYFLEHPIKVNPQVLRLDLNKLEILLVALHWRVDVHSMDENARQRVFEKAVKLLEHRKMSWKEVSHLTVALGYPAPKRSKFKEQVQMAIESLVLQLRRDLKRAKKINKRTQQIWTVFK